MKLTSKDLTKIQTIMESMVDPDPSPYMDGNCGLLALKLHDMSGWPINVLSDPDGEPWYVDEDEDGMEYTHVVVEHPSGKYLDSHGLRSNAEISEDFGLQYMDSYELSRDQLIHLLSDDGPFDCWMDDGEVIKYSNYLYSKFGNP